MKKETIDRINKFGKEFVPFVALISYDSPHEDIVCTVENASKYGISYKYCDNSVSTTAAAEPTPRYSFKKHYIDFESYNDKFDRVKKLLDNGTVELVNLCLKTPLSTELSLQEIYDRSKASLVVMLDGRFVCFTPEIFTCIDGSTITTYPMKGTISADIPDAQTVLLNNSKEYDEQVRICRLMKQELSAVSHNINIDKFRYFTKVQTVKGDIWQTSSQISGILKPEYNGKNWGDLFEKLLPAGSISGTPKEDTVKLLREVENEQRGFYSGIFIHFDGKICRSYVLIRFVGRDKNGNLYYHSGGGITPKSEPLHEYEELKKKVYLTF